MARLASKFAGILLVNVPDKQAAALQQKLESMSDKGLRVTVEHGADSAATAYRRLSLELLGQDRPGIMHDIAQTLSVHGISIEELETGTRSASMAGGTLFEARATLVAPQAMHLGDLQSVLEALANELMVEIELAEDD